MKKFFLLCSFLLLMLSFRIASGSDIYWIVFLKGNVYKQDSDKALKLGDKIASDLKLKFSDKEAYAVVMSSRGKYTLRPEINKSKPNEFVAFVNSALLPVKSTGRLSTRGEESGVSDLATYFGEDSFALIGNTYPVKLDQRKFELNDEKFLIYRYENQGTIVSKKIAFEGSRIFLDKEALYTSSSGHRIDPGDISKVELYKYDASSKSSSKLVTFKPVFIEENELIIQLSAVYKVCQGLSLTEAQTEDELIRFVLDIYGRTDETVLKKWIKDNIL